MAEMIDHCPTGKVLSELARGSPLAALSTAIAHQLPSNIVEFIAAILQPHSSTEPFRLALQADNADNVNAILQAGCRINYSQLRKIKSEQVANIVCAHSARVNGAEHFEAIVQACQESGIADNHPIVLALHERRLLGPWHTPVYTQTLQPGEEVQAFVRATAMHASKFAIQTLVHHLSETRRLESPIPNIGLTPVEFARDKSNLYALTQLVNLGATVNSLTSSSGYCPICASTQWPIVLACGHETCLGCIQETCVICTGIQ